MKNGRSKGEKNKYLAKEQGQMNNKNMSNITCH